MVDYTGSATGALSGATTGGTFGGPIGAAVGGLAGGIAGLFGSKKKKKRVSAFDKRQKELNKQQHKAILGEGPLADLYNYNPEQANDVFDKTIANPEYRNLNEKGIPSLTGQFRNSGLMNSSYAGDAVGRLIRDVQEKLAGERSRYLYGEQKEARTAKQNAVENLQNRSTFAYDTNSQNNRFDINKVINSVSPQMISGVQDYFRNKSPSGNGNNPTNNWSPQVNNPGVF